MCPIYVCLRQIGDPCFEINEKTHSLIEETLESLRIYYQNVNGLKMRSGDSFLNQAVGFLVDFKVGATYLTETNVN